MRDRLQMVLEDVQAPWSDRTFGTPEERNARGPLEHLRKEVDEAWLEPGDITEYADCVLLIYDAARRSGFTYDQLVTAVEEKMQINLKRNWGPAKPNGAVEHVR